MGWLLHGKDVRYNIALSNEAKHINPNINSWCNASSPQFLDILVFVHFCALQSARLTAEQAPQRMAGDSILPVPNATIGSKLKLNIMETQTNNKTQAHILEKLTPELKTLVLAIAEEITPLIEEIHSKPETTKYYYGDYMRILSYSPKQAKLIALAMMYIGVNPTGLQYAIKNVIG